MRHSIERSTTRLTAKLAGIAMLPILLCSAASDADTRPLDELASAGMQFTNVRVGRIDEIVTLAGLDADTPLKSVSLEVGDYWVNNPGSADVDGLVAHLELTHESAEEQDDDGYEYEYVIGPGGVVYRFCTRKIQILVFDAGDPEPVVVTAIEEMSV